MKLERAGSPWTTGAGAPRAPATGEAARGAKVQRYTFCATGLACPRWQGPVVEPRLRNWPGLTGPTCLRGGLAVRKREAKAALQAGGSRAIKARNFDASRCARNVPSDATKIKTKADAPGRRAIATGNLILCTGTYFVINTPTATRRRAGERPVCTLPKTVRQAGIGYATHDSATWDNRSPELHIGYRCGVPLGVNGLNAGMLQSYRVSSKRT